MSTLFLIRHGQASFGSANYDVLSALGAEQSQCLGHYWAGRGVHIDACYSGPMRRQVDTMRIIRDSAQAAGASYPEAQVLDDLGEYPAMELLARWLPAVCAEDPDLADLMVAPAAPANKKRFMRAFELILYKWSRGELDTGELESFVAFQTRVRRGFLHIMAREGRDRTVAVVTSGGPIAMATQMALGLSDETALRMAWVLSNASINEFRYRDDQRLTLVRFNTIPHLPASLHTFR